jgi:hypothetical protein
MTEQLPPPLVMVYTAPTLLHDPELVYVIGSPELAVATTAKLVP